ncbi:MAG TPA: glutamate--cysteine ligase [Acidimicrobiales bacterium]|jgi:carboxylate-amine ligase|nr:glutamate--cysteine ligase [Acidimicrobiales bacterium]
MQRGGLTLGVEEEYLVVDAASGALVPQSGLVLAAAQQRLGDDVTGEVNLCQIEVATPVCRTLDEVRGHLTRLRRELAAAAAETGHAIVAAGTHPFSRWENQQVDVSNDRYRRMVEHYQIVARQQVICGCHVHVGVDDRDAAVAAMTRTRPWLPVLLALSANSPFWQGLDTGYASYRFQVWQRWPTCGMPPPLTTRAEFDELVQQLEAIDAVEDSTFLYWYVRPSARFPTLEFRPGDVCLTIDDAVALAGLVRALAWTALGESDDVPPSGAVLDAAMWRASRYGLAGSLVSPRGLAVRPAVEVVGELLDHVGAGLEAHGDTAEVSELVGAIMARGNGAQVQRDAAASGAGVVARLLQETSPEVTPTR